MSNANSRAPIAIGLVAVAILAGIAWLLFDARQDRIAAARAAEARASADAIREDIQRRMKESDERVEFEYMLENLGKP